MVSETPFVYVGWNEIKEIFQNKYLGIDLFYYRYYTWKGKTKHLEDLIGRQDKANWRRDGCIAELSVKAKVIKCEE